MGPISVFKLYHKKPIKPVQRSGSEKVHASRRDVGIRIGHFSDLVRCRLPQGLRSFWISTAVCLLIFEE